MPRDSETEISRFVPWNAAHGLPRPALRQCGGSHGRAEGHHAAGGRTGRARKQQHQLHREENRNHLRRVYHFGERQPKRADFATFERETRHQAEKQDRGREVQGDLGGQHDLHHQLRFGHQGPARGQPVQRLCLQFLDWRPHRHASHRRKSAQCRGQEAHRRRLRFALCRRPREFGLAAVEHRAQLHHQDRQRRQLQPQRTGRQKVFGFRPQGRQLQPLF